MKRWISLPRVEGEASRQAHADLPPGSHEREIGREGFYGPATHMYHRHAPTGWSGVEGPLRPRAYDTRKLDPVEGSPWHAAELFRNAHLSIRFWRSSGNMERLARNADGDELLFVHEGVAALFCDYGHLELREGDYLWLPRGTLWRLEANAAFALLLIEATGQGLGLPERGLLGEHAIFDPAVLETPRIDATFRAQQDEREWRVAVKARGTLSTLTYPYNPLDAVGWKGTLAPVRLNWRDIRPVMSARYHLPPSVHTTFAADRFVVCTFCPRPLESDPGALRLPFYHSNDDFDELIFYHRGSFQSRDGIEPGMLTLHPSGLTHGPQPKAVAAAQRHERGETDEVAVMVDARDALEPQPAAERIEWMRYADSWKS